MGIDGASANRRPLKSRGTAWAAAAARLVLASGISADAVSILGIVISLVGATALVLGFANPWQFLIGAAAVQLRLLCNMLDGMVALKGGRKSLYGPIYNEMPDRLEDSLLLVAAGYSAGIHLGLVLGLTAALLAAICAYVRLLGGTLGQPQDFSGPQAKPHRMFVLTLGLAAAFIASLAGENPGRWLVVALGGDLHRHVVDNRQTNASDRECGFTKHDCCDHHRHHPFSRRRRWPVAGLRSKRTPAHLFRQPLEPSRHDHRLGRHAAGSQASVTSRGRSRLSGERTVADATSRSRY